MDNQNDIVEYPEIEQDDSERNVRARNRALQQQVEQLTEELDSLRQRATLQSGESSNDSVALLAKALLAELRQKDDTAGYQKAIKRAPLFMGSNQVGEVCRWLTKAQLYMEEVFPTLSEDKWQTKVSTLLDGDALVWYKQANSTEEFQCWKQFKTRFFTRWTGQTLDLRIVREMQRCTQGNRTITDYVAQFRQLISLQDAAGCSDSEATYVERLIANLQPALISEARKFLAEYVTLQRHRHQASADRSRPMFDALVEYLTQRNVKDGAKSRALNVVAKVTQKSKEPIKRCINCGETYGMDHFCPRYCWKCGQHKTSRDSPCKCHNPASEKTKVNQVGIKTKMEPERTECRLVQKPGYQKEQLTFCFAGQVQGKKLKILVDTGAQENFISEEFVEKHKLPTRNVPIMELRMADGNASESSHATKAMTFTILQNHGPSWSFRGKLRLTNLNSGYDILLGEPWLRDYGAQLCYGTKSLFLKQANRKLYPSCHSSILPAYRFIQQVQQDGDPDGMGIAVIRPQKEVSETIQEDPVVSNLKEKYHTIFVDGLPPERTSLHVTEHKIPLKPGTEPICQPLRRMAPKLGF